MPPAEQLKHAIRVRVNEVTAPVTVRDPKGEMVFDLTQENFRVYDNGAEQKIDHFDVGGDPLSIVLVIETSSHIQPMFPSVKHAGNCVHRNGDGADVGSGGDQLRQHGGPAPEIHHRSRQRAVRDRAFAAWAWTMSTALRRDGAGESRCSTNGRRCGGGSWWWSANRRTRAARTGWAKCCGRRSLRT